VIVSDGERLDGASWDLDDPLHNQVVPLLDGNRLAIGHGHKRRFGRGTQLAPGRGVGPIVVHHRRGGAARKFSRTCNALDTGALAQLFGKFPQGVRTSLVHNKVGYGVRRIERFTVELEF
jgi:hypothetical protein